MVHFVRIVHTGGQKVTAEVLKELDSDPVTAEAIKRELGLRLGNAETADGRHAVDVIAGVVREQLAAIRNTIAYYQNLRRTRSPACCSPEAAHSSRAWQRRSAT